MPYVLRKRTPCSCTHGALCCHAPVREAAVVDAPIHHLPATTVEYVSTEELISRIPHEAMRCAVESLGDGVLTAEQACAVFNAAQANAPVPPEPVDPIDPAHEQGAV